MTESIYMPLLDEGTDVWVIVQAESLGSDRFRVLGPMPTDEQWRFQPGTIVRVQAGSFGNRKEGFEAIEDSE